MPFRRSQRRKKDTQTLILLLVSALALLAAYGAWKGLAAIRKYTASSQKYDTLILEISERHGVDPCLVKAVIWRESRFRPYARGTSGEIGLMQIKYEAAKDWARAMDVAVPAKEDLYDPYLNITIGVWYLGRALSRWQGRSTTTGLALFEYNAGRRTVITWIAHYDGDTKAVIDRGPSARYIRAIMKNILALKKTTKASPAEIIASNP